MVNLDDVLEGPKIAFCETVVEFDLGHDDYSVWQVHHFGCLGLIFSWQAQYFVDLDQKWLFEIFKVHFAGRKQCFVKI